MGPMSDTPPPHARLSLPLRILGATLLLGGLGHFAGVARAYAAHGFPERHRAGYVGMIGLCHLTSGALDMLAGRGLRRGEGGAARVAVISALLTVGWTGIDMPVVAEASALLRLMPAVYFATHLAVLGAIALSARPGR